MKAFKRAYASLFLASLPCVMASGCIVGIVDLDEDPHSWDREATALFDRDLPVVGQVGIRVIGVNGEVTILGVAGVQEVTVRGTKRVRSSSLADAQAHLADLQVRIQSGQGEFRVETVQPEHTDRRGYVVDYEITVPDYFRVLGVTANGNLFLEGIQSDVEVEVGNGNVTMEGVAGSAWASLGNGNLSASMSLPHGGEIVFSVGNGSAALALQPAVSAHLKAQVGNGTIVVSGLSLANEVSGPNVLRGTLGSGAGSIDLTVGNGNIRVRGR